MKSLQEYIVAHPKLGMVVPVEYARGLIEQARREEREACAKICEANHALIAESLDGYDIAAAIRARGEGK